MTFEVIELTTNQATNVFYSIPIYTMFIVLPTLALLDLFKKF